jgi:DNA-damage-inducible protein D
MDDLELAQEEVESHTSLFAQIRHEAEEGYEYWSARELARAIGYNDYRNFLKVVEKARLACENSGQPVEDHFVDVTDMIAIGKGGKRKVADILLTRYACYLIVQNADPAKEVVALGQTYFAVQTQRIEQQDELAGLNEVEKRLYLRGELSRHNRQLAEAANQAGVILPIDFAIFQDHGYMGLYGGLKNRDIHTKKNLASSQHILDHMGSTELAANLFRATQAEEKLRREGIQGKSNANRTHFEVGRKVRQTIEELGGTLPENLPTPEESIKQLERQEKKRLAQGPQETSLPD